VYSISTLILVAIGALASGLGAGLLYSRRLSPDTRKQRELERSLERLLQQQKDYQHEVGEHFTDTAKLLNNLAESYRDVHNHLAGGASELCDDQAGNILRRLPDNSMTDFAAEPDPDGVQAPLDYAPKASPYAQGVLNEEFGLQKEAAPEEQAQVLEEMVIPKQA
jgi:uncharacterized membrane-anchored protein YhcB (DUF1043 family)